MLLVTSPFLDIDCYKELCPRSHDKELEDIRRGFQEVSSHPFLTVTALFLYSSLLAGVT